MWLVSPLIFAFGMSIALGLLVGLQREWAEGEIAGIRTFPLIALFGALCAWLADLHGGWVLAAGVVTTGATLLVADLHRWWKNDLVGGVTTEFAALVMFGVGALLVEGQTVVATVTTGVAAGLLQWKEPLHALVGRIERHELQAIMRLALVALVILPVLPDATLGPYEVLNPREVWQMVVLIVGISLAGYLAQRALGPGAGTLLGGLLGGLVSSTATSVGQARRTRGDGAQAPAAAVVISVASAVVFGRLLVEIGVASPGLLREMGPPLVAMLAWMLLLSAVAWVLLHGAPAAAAPPQDPGDLVGAVVFGLLYAGVLLASAAVSDHFGGRALYLLAAVSGLTDVDAITLSTTSLASEGRISADAAWRVVLVAALANLCFKAVAVAALGSRALGLRVAVLFGLGAAGAGAILAFWP